MPPKTAAIIKWKKPFTNGNIEGKGKSGAIYQVVSRPVDRRGRPADPLKTDALWKWFYESRGSEGGPFDAPEEAKASCHSMEESALVGTRARSKSSLRAQAKTKAVVERMRKARVARPDFDDLLDAKVEAAAAAIKGHRPLPAITRSDLKKFPVHPAAAEFPMMSEAELDAMAADILANGQQEPIVIGAKGEVLDGRNRLDACQRAGVEPKLVRRDLEEEGISPTAWILSKNKFRRHLTPDQQAMVAARMLKHFEAEAKARQRLSKNGAKGSATGALPFKGKAAEQAARSLGSTTRKVERAKWLAKADPARAEQVAAGTLTLKKAEKEIKRAEQREEIKAYVPPSGKFQVITTDFSWKYRDTLDGSDAIRGGPPYPPQTVEEIIAFVNGPLANCCDEVCLYGAWVTNPILLDLETWPKVQAAIEGLGFRPVKLETWRKIEESGKPFTGLGNGVRNDTEQLVLFARGTVLYNDLGEEHGRPLQRTCFDAPKGEHSEKPALAYERLEQLVPYTSRLEMFSRAPRAGWVTSGSELPKPVEKTEIEIQREMANAPPVEGRDFTEMPRDRSKLAKVHNPEAHTVLRRSHTASEAAEKVLAGPAKERKLTPLQTKPGYTPVGKEAS